MIGDQRKSKRFTSRGNLQAEIIDSEDFELIGKNVACESINISADGVQLLMKQHVPVGTELDIWLSVPKSKQQAFHLQSKVCWIKLTPDESAYRVGLDISLSDNSDLKQWYRLGFPEKK